MEMYHSHDENIAEEKRSDPYPKETAEQQHGGNQPSNEGPTPTHLENLVGNRSFAASRLAQDEHHARFFFGRRERLR